MFEQEGPISGKVLAPYGASLSHKLPLYNNFPADFRPKSIGSKVPDWQHTLRGGSEVVQVMVSDD